MKTITIMSGKGGVGKSSITASLAVLLSKKYNLVCADCDVDASNLPLVLGVNDYDEWKNISTNFKAEFDLKKCISCKKCFDICYFNSIEWYNNKPRIKKFSCEGCGACEVICPKNAISLKKVNNAKIGYAITKFGFKVVFSQLNPGESGSGKIVSEVKKKAIKLDENIEYMLVDSSAGIGCPVIASVSGSDFVLLVTEPTPSGFFDLKRALKIVNHFKIDYGIVINKSDLNKDYTNNMISELKENSKFIYEISYDKSFSKALVELVPIIDYNKKYLKIFNDLGENILKEL